MCSLLSVFLACFQGDSGIQLGGFGDSGVQRGIQVFGDSGVRVFGGGFRCSIFKYNSIEAFGLNYGVPVWVCWFAFLQLRAETIGGLLSGCEGFVAGLTP